MLVLRRRRDVVEWTSWVRIYKHVPLKLEQLNVCHQQAFKEFLGVNIPELKNTHVTELDPSKPMYLDFVKNTVFPKGYLDRMYTSDFAQHFYSEDEISGFREKWSGRIL